LKKAQEELDFMRSSLNKQDTSEEMKIEELEQEVYRNNTPFFEGLRPSSDKLSSDRHFNKLSSIYELDTLDDEEIERRLRMMYA